MLIIHIPNHLGNSYLGTFSMYFCHQFSNRNHGSLLFSVFYNLQTYPHCRFFVQAKEPKDNVYRRFINNNHFNY